MSQFVLSNGLQVLLEEDHRQKLVAIRMTYAIGSRDEPKAQRGIAHLVEHLTFRGSRHLKDDEMSGLFQLAGAGDMNGETSADETSYHETVSSGALALGLWLERERMAFTAEQFNVQTLSSEQAILHREETTRKGEDETLIMALLNAMSGDHRPYAEWTDDLPSVSKLTLQDVRSFFMRGHRPDNARLVLVGDFQSVAARSLIERYFGGIESPALPKVKTTVGSAPLSSGGHVRLVRNLIRDDVVMGWRVPFATVRDEARLHLFMTLLRSDWERRAAPKEKRVARLYIRALPLSLGSVCVIYASLFAGATHEQGATAVREEVARFTEKVLANELQDARRRAMLELAYISEDFALRAEFQMRALSLFGHSVRIQDYWRELDSVSVDSLVGLTRLLVPNLATQIDGVSTEHADQDGKVQVQP